MLRQFRYDEGRRIEKIVMENLREQLGDNYQISQNAYGYDIVLQNDEEQLFIEVKSCFNKTKYTSKKNGQKKKGLRSGSFSIFRKQLKKDKNRFFAFVKKYKNNNQVQIFYAKGKDVLELLNERKGELLSLRLSQLYLLPKKTKFTDLIEETQIK